MKRLYWLFGIVPALLLVNMVGCDSAADTGDEALFPPTKGGSVAVQLQPVEAKESGTITGTVTFDGQPPVMTDLSQVAGHGDNSHCIKGDIKDQTWVVDPATNGVANVVVWVDPPKGSYFRKPEKKTWADNITVDQPFCAFIPHVVVLYPETYDDAAKALTPTGQKLVVKNSAPILHNIRVSGRDNPSRGGNVQPGTQQEFSLRKDRQEVALNCDIHKWMTGYALTFDHPFAAVTDKTGKFTIQNVPAGAEITFLAWHESKRKFVPLADNKIKLNANETKTIDFKITK